MRWAPSRDQLRILGTLVDGGVRIDDALLMLERAAGDRATRAGAGEVRTQVRAGVALSDALTALGASRHVVASIRSGERTGRLSDALHAAASLVGELERLQASLRRAFTYPGLVLSIGVAMAIVIATTVVPSLERTFLDLGGTLPLATRLVLMLTGPLGDPRILIVPVVVLFLLRRVARRQHVGLMGGPLVRVLLRGFMEDLDVSVLASLVSVQLRTGVALVDALDAAAEAMGDPGRRRIVRQAAAGVRAGRRAVEVDGLASLLRPAELELVAVAERTGALADQWLQVAALRRERLDDRIQRLASTLEPVLVLVVGLLVGGIILALYLPTFRVLELL